MDSNPIHHPSPANKMKCSFLDYVHFWWSADASWWTWTPSATPLLPKIWNAHFLIMFNFWWSAGLVNGLKTHLPPLSSQKNEMLIFGLHSTSDDRPSWLMDSNPIHHPSPVKKMKSSFLDYVHFWWSAGLVDGLEPHIPTLSIQKNEMLIFWFCSTSDDQPGCSMDSNPICQPSPANKMKCFFLDYVHFWWSASLVDGLKPHLPPLSSQ